MKTSTCVVDDLAAPSFAHFTAVFRIPAETALPDRGPRLLPKFSRLVSHACWAIQPRSLDRYIHEKTGASWRVWAKRSLNGRCLRTKPCTSSWKIGTYAAT